MELLAAEVFGHSYKAGTPDTSLDNPCDPDPQQSNLGELKRATPYQLVGVTGSDKRLQFNPMANAVISGIHEIKRDPNLLHCVLGLPWPDSIYSLRRYSDAKCPSSKFFTGADAKRIQATELSLAQVLVHTAVAVDFDRLQLDPPVGWTPRPNPSNAVHLHIFAEASGPMNMNHTATEFETLIKLLPEIKDLKLNCSNPDLSDPQPAPPPGIEQWELNSLPEICKTTRKIVNCLGIVPSSGGT